MHQVFDDVRVSFLFTDGLDEPFVILLDPLPLRDEPRVCFTPKVDSVWDLTTGFFFAGGVLLDGFGVILSSLSSSTL